ncbi:RNAse P Rpr2/Rpp21/SNM1 subunit domain-containing protein [Fomes fomentarius]|nr:RNAse P Rpr2/Rpp21/SNM1 subunit domain-containing protein [Fomes fomentarius]
MGKKNRNQEPVASLNNVANRDIIQRINFLYQASTYLNTIAQWTPLNHGQVYHKDRGKTRNSIRNPQNTSELSRSYVSTMRIVGQKAMVRMDPSIKRTLCKKCDTILVPGSTSSVRIKTRRGHGQIVTYTCHTCGTVRRIPAAPVLIPDALPTEETALPVSNDTYTVNPPSLAAGPCAVAGGNETSAMDVDPPAPQISSAEVRRVRKPRQPPHMPPLFERQGHVIFRGNEVLTQ